MSFNRLIQNQAVTGIKRITRSVKSLESNQAFPIMTGLGTVSNPPTTSEINAIFDTPSNVGQDFVGFIIDTVNGYEFLVWTDGTTWYVISQAGSTTPTMGARVYPSGSTSLTTGVLTTISFDTEDYDTDGFITVPSTRLTIPQDGVYLINATVVFASNATGYRELVIQSGNPLGTLTQQTQNATNGTDTGMNVSVIAYAPAGKYFTMNVRQTSGGNLNISGGTSAANNFPTQFAISRIG